MLTSGLTARVSWKPIVPFTAIFFTKVRVSSPLILVFMGYGSSVMGSLNRKLGVG
jgi:hypothetical protein